MLLYHATTRRRAGTMKVTIDGIRLDTEKAKFSVTLYWLDDHSNQHTGEVYMSSQGQWYIYTPSQWGNQHRWELASPESILNDYDRYRTDEKKDQIASLGGLDWQ